MRIYFGFAKIKPIEPERGKVRVQFRDVSWSGQARPFSLFTNESQFDATRIRQRFANMLSDIAASGTPDRCFAFVLGSIRDKDPKFLNIDLGRGLDEVLLFPVPEAGKWLAFERAWERFNGIRR